jgi:hypothetical protein
VKAITDRPQIAKRYAAQRISGASRRSQIKSLVDSQYRVASIRQPVAPGEIQSNGVESVRRRRHESNVKMIECLFAAGVPKAD